LSNVSKSRVGKLEEKLDGLVSLIKSAQNAESSQQVMSGVTSSSTAIPSPSFLAASMPFVGPQAQESPARPSAHHGSMLSQFVPFRQSPSLAPSLEGNRPANSNSVLASNLMPSFGEANVLLAVFRDQLTPQFPFIVLSQSVSAESLSQERPLFYISILAVTSRDSVQQQALGKIVMKQLSERVFEKGERNLDLLLGALTYASWFVCLFP
jgi:hypothetical protein